MDSCAAIGGLDGERCEYVFTKTDTIEDDMDSLRLLTYIISGALGGVALVLIIVLIALSVKLKGLYAQLAIILHGPSLRNTNDNASRKTSIVGNQEYEKQLQLDKNAQRRVPNDTTSQSSLKFSGPPNDMTSQQELADRGYEAYTGRPVPMSNPASFYPDDNSTIYSVPIKPKPTPPSPPPYRNKPVFDRFKY